MQAFGACLQRTRLRNFLWTQPLLLAPMLWMGRAHCSAQLAAAPEAATHVRRIVAALQRCSLWLPMQPLQDAVATGAAAAGAAAAGQLAADDGRTACVAVHFWLVLILAFCLPAIVIHRLEGAEQQAQEERKARQPAARGADGAPRPGDKARGMLLQRRTPVVDSAIEFALAAYVAWLVVQLAVPMLT